MPEKGWGHRSGVRECVLEQSLSERRELERRKSSVGRGGAGAEIPAPPPTRGWWGEQEEAEGELEQRAPHQGLGGQRGGEQEEAEGGGSTRPQPLGLGRAPRGWGSWLASGLEGDGKKRTWSPLLIYLKNALWLQKRNLGAFDSDPL